MMSDVYVLDKSLAVVGVVDAYRSLIWSNRYREQGDCELYVKATSEYLTLLQKGYYLMRTDDDMVCQIRKIELDTSGDDGNYLIITGYDVKGFLDQRIIWSTMSCNGSVEDFARSMVQTTLCNPTLSSRQLQKPNGDQLLYLGNSAGFTETISEQVSYKNVGEKIREYCQTYNWGYRVVLSDSLFWFQLYEGTDRTDSVIFSDEYENLASTAYIEDDSSMGNVALVAGEGEGSDRARNVFGYAEGVDRYELFVDAKDISKSITWADLIDVYPTTDSGGQGYLGTEDGYPVYKLNYLNIEIIDSNQEDWLETNFPDGQHITISGVDFYQVYNEVIADLASSSPTDDTAVVLRDIIYSGYLLNRGSEAVAEYGSVVSFEGSVIPDVTFIYKEDYYLGDLVTVRNEYGIESSARIVEVVEVNDDNGYSIEPHFEYLERESATYTVPSGQTIQYESGAESMTDQKIEALESAVSGGTISELTNTAVTFSNGLRWLRARNNVTESLTGTQVGSSGIYRYTKTFTVAYESANRPIGVGCVYLNTDAVSIPAAIRFDGSSSAGWTSMTYEFYWPESTISSQTIAYQTIYGYLSSAS